MTFAKSLAFILCALALLFSRPMITAAAATWEVVVSDLDNPRGLAFGPEGALYIAQAGSGGDGPCGEGPEGTRCYGETGAIARYDPRDGSVTNVVTGLPSLATEAGQMFAIGPNDLSLPGPRQPFLLDRLWRRPRHPWRLRAERRPTGPPCPRDTQRQMAPADGSRSVRRREQSHGGRRGLESLRHARARRKADRGGRRRERAP